MLRGKEDLIKSVDTQRPANLYYFRPYPAIYACLYIVMGAVLCSGLSSDSDLQGKWLAVIWSIYITSLLLLMVIDPLFCTEKKRIDEIGRTVKLRRPVVGWKSTEHVLALDSLADGLYTGNTNMQDARFGDVSLFRWLGASLVSRDCFIINDLFLNYLTNLRVHRVIAMGMHIGGYEGVKINSMRYNNVAL